jgi:hypothetical protein
MFGDSSVGLLFKLSAQDNVSDVLKKIRSNVESETSAIGSKGSAELDKLTGSSKVLGASFAGLANPVGLAAAAIASVGAAGIATAVGLFNLAKSASDYGSKIHDIAQQTGLGAETISTLKFAAEQAGKSIETVANGLSIFEKNVGKAAQGGKEATAVMKRLGIDPQAAINDLDGALAKVFLRISQLKPGIEQNTAAQEAFGKSGKELIGVITDVGGNFDEFKQKAKELGVVLTDEDARAAEEFGDSLDKLKSQAQGVAFQFARQFMPDITQAMDEVSKYFTANQEVVRGWGQAVGTYLRDTLQEIKSQGGGWEDAGAVIARRFVDGFATIVVKGITGAVNAAAEQARRDFERGQNQFDPIAYGSRGGIAVYNAATGKGSPPIKPQNELTAFQVEAEVGIAGGTAGAVVVKKLNKIVDNYTRNLSEGAKKTKKSSGRKAIEKELLPASGDGFTTYKRNAKEQFAKPEAIDNLKIIAAAFKNLTGKSLQVGDGSRADQKKFGPHEGHRDLETFDLRPIRKDGRDLPTNINDKQYDQAATRALIEIIKKVVPDALVRFNDPKFVREGLTKQTDGHDNHLDVSNLGGKGNLVNLDKLEEDKRKKAKDAADDAAKAAEKARDERIKLIEDENKRVAQLDAEQTATRVKELDSELDQKLISQEEYAREIGQLQINLIKNEQAANEKLLANPELDSERRAELIQAQRILSEKLAQQVIENSDRQREAIKKVTDEYKAQLDAIRALQAQVNDQRRANEDDQKGRERDRLEKDLGKGNAKDRLDALVVLKEFDIQEADRRAARATNDAILEHQKQIAKIEDIEKERAKVEEINNLYKARIDALNAERQATKEKVEAESQAPIRTGTLEAGGGIAGQAADILGGIVGGTVDPLNKITEQAEYMKSVYGDLAGMAKGAIGSMVQGLGQLAAQWLATGKFSAKAALQMVSGIASGLAIEAGLKALMQYAEGLALAANPFTAALAPGHFAAAAAYGVAAAAAGAVGIGTGLLARAAGGGSGSASSSAFKQSTASGAATGTNGETVDRNKAVIREENRNQAPQQAQTVVHKHEVTVRAPRGFVVNEFIEDFRSLGDTHGLIMKVVEG